MRDTEPIDCDERIRVWFAFWPVYCGREMRWFERVTVHQIYDRWNGWQNIEFL